MPRDVTLSRARTDHLLSLADGFERLDVWLWVGKVERDSVFSNHLLVERTSHGGQVNAKVLGDARSLFLMSLSTLMVTDEAAIFSSILLY